MVRRPPDLLVLHAVRHGLEPGWNTRRVAAELVEMARGRRSLLERALGRIELVLLQRPSRAGQRAREALREALAGLDGDISLVPARVEVGSAASRRRR